MSLTPTKTGWSLQLRIGGGERQRFPIIAPDATAAKKRAAVMTELARLLVESGRLAEARPALTTLGAIYDGAEFQGAAQGVREICAEPLAEAKRAELGAAVTFRDFGRLWTSGELARRYPDFFKVKKSVEQDISRLEHLYRTIGSVPIEKFTRADAKRAMDHLPATTRTASSRRHYAQLIAFLLGKAVEPCALIEHNPIPRGFKPKNNRPPEYPFLYPAEDVQLLACPTIELGLRLLYGFSCREGWRKGDSRLPWKAFDLERGIVNTAVTKTGEVRSWKLFPGTREALVAYRKGLGDPAATTLVFPLLSDTAEAEIFRANLRLAGIERPELFETAEGRGAIRFHDLRASFITIALAMGRTEAWITDRTGHTTSQMLYRYKRKARLAAELGDWTPLDVALGLVDALNTPGATAEDLRSGVARNLARNFSEENGRVKVTTEHHSLLAGTPGGIRTPDQWIRKPASLYASEALEPNSADSCAPDCSEGLSVPPPRGGGGTQIPLNATPSRARDFKCRTDAPGAAKPAESVGRDTPVAAGTDGPSQSAVTVLDGLRAAARAALEANNWALLHQLEPLIDAEQKRLTASVPVSLEAVRAKREGGK
ncbi:MAG TPA: hypothetical protein VIU86_19860 [Gaiellaceae bacterium]